MSEISFGSNRPGCGFWLQDVQSLANQETVSLRAVIKEGLVCWPGVLQKRQANIFWSWSEVSRASLSRCCVWCCAQFPSSPQGDRL